MLKQTITYTDFNDVERTEDFFFNLSKAELIEMELSADGGFQKMINDIIASQDNAQIIKIFKELILKSYGVKSEDGKRFIKNAEIAAEFEQSGAYSELFMKLATDTDAATAFINGIMPRDLVEQANTELAKQGDKVITMNK